MDIVFHMISGILEVPYNCKPVLVPQLLQKYLNLNPEVYNLKWLKFIPKTLQKSGRSRNRDYF